MLARYKELLAITACHQQPSNDATLTLPDDLDQKCRDAFKVTPNDIQRNVIEHISKGLDYILIASSGWGKSLVYTLPLVLWEDRSIFVICSSDCQAEEQQLALQNQYGINCIAYSSYGAVKRNLLQDLTSGKYRALFIGPDMINYFWRLERLWASSAWKNRLQAIVIDEPHCVSTWGQDYFKAHEIVGRLRWVMPHDVAFMTLSATLLQENLRDLIRNLRSKPDVPIFNASNNRPNVRLEVCQLPNKSSNTSPFEPLRFLAQERPLQKTIVYLKDEEAVMDARAYLESYLPKTDKDKIASYHSLFRRLPAREDASVPGG
ncbi:hypothetical protein BGX23_011110 [Mortierella sp. AD031]|nr:hypothetical protein BGX23_011110 [Mortierella sp. AD031]